MTRAVAPAPQVAAQGLRPGLAENVDDFTYNELQVRLLLKVSNVFKFEQLLLLCWPPIEAPLTCIGASSSSQGDFETVNIERAQLF